MGYATRALAVYDSTAAAVVVSLGAGRPAAADDEPEEPVEQTKPWKRMTPFQHGKLLAQCQILEQEALTRAKEAKDVPKATLKNRNMAKTYTRNVGGEDRSDVIEVIDSKGGWSFGEAQVETLKGLMPEPPRE